MAFRDEYKFAWRKNGRKYLKASFTVEAAVVMPVIIISLVGIILFGYKLHDIVTANITANEMAELYGHSTGNDNAERIYEYGNTRLSGLFSGRKYEIEIDKSGDGSIVTVKGSEGRRTFEDAGFQPQKFMRKMTILEEVIDNE